MCRLYSSVQKHTRTKGHFKPKLMFLDVNVLWEGGKKKKKTAIYCIVSWPGLNQPVFFIKPVYRPACSTVLLGFFVVCSVEQMLQ